jgi:tetratricopeptide (TPR) repeat protein
VLLLAASLVVYFLIPHPSSLIPVSVDPRRAYAGPFQNVSPDVPYVADSRCADCHLDKARSFAEHPMGRSLLPVSQAAAPPEDARHNNPFQALGSQFLVKREGSKVLHRRTQPGPHGRPAADLEWEVQYALGSGTHGYAYLSNRGGFLFETPISWYSQKKIWDLSPGFRQPRLTGRTIIPECLFCHANRAKHIEGSKNHYAEPIFEGFAIGCQRCHGPGELHVASRKRAEPVSEKVDYTIVNPRHLEPSLREAVCEQCHLQGQELVLRRGRGLYDFRPGLPPQLFWSIFVDSLDVKESQKAVGHVEQMYQSSCFRGGPDGPERLGCISCHDPHQHVAPAQRVAYYRGRCLQCHERKGCSVPPANRLRQAPGDSCIDCHMPHYASSDIPHAASTDHRIPRSAKSASPSAALPARADGIPLVSFYDMGKWVDESEAERDRAVALIKQARLGNPSPPGVMRNVLGTLENALRRDPADLLVGEARGYALALQNRWSEALLAFQTVLDIAPEQELVLVGAAGAAEELKDTETAAKHWRRVVAANPWEPGYRRHLAMILVKKEAWAEAEPHCQAWVRLDPMSSEAGTAHLSCLLAIGKKDEARKEFARIKALAPANLAELQIRFEKKLR